MEVRKLKRTERWEKVILLLSGMVAPLLYQVMITLIYRWAKHFTEQSCQIMNLWTVNEVNSVDGFSLCFIDRIQLTAPNTQPMTNALLTHTFKIKKDPFTWI